MTIAQLTALVAFVSIVMLVPADAQQATFMKKPKALGAKLSTVETRASTDGSHFMCRGKCDPASPWGYWRCDGTPSTVICVLSCVPIPKPECVAF
jgi:hypothetical protein